MRTPPGSAQMFLACGFGSDGAAHSASNAAPSAAAAGSACDPHADRSRLEIASTASRIGPLWGSSINSD